MVMPVLRESRNICLRKFGKTRGMPQSPFPSLAWAVCQKKALLAKRFFTESFAFLLVEGNHFCLQAGLHCAVVNDRTDNERHYRAHRYHAENAENADSEAERP